VLFRSVLSSLTIILAYQSATNALAISGDVYWMGSLNLSLTSDTNEFTVSNN